jgi:Fe-S cluster biogenesis protein NfuA
MSVEISHQEIVNRVEAALEKIRPFLIKDGGNVELVDVIEGETVRVKLLGACRSCDISHMTLKAGIEDSIISAIPGIKEVVSID